VHSVALGALTAYAAFALYLTWLNFITFGAEERRLSPEEHPWYFPVLVAHVATSSIALIACIPQVWPWFRRRYSRLHRYFGRVYVFAGVLPAVLSALALIMFWPFSVVSEVGHVFVAMIWASITTYGFVLARQGRTADHRRWMLRSFALTVSVLLGMILSVPINMLLRMQLDTRLEGSEDILRQMSLSTENWLAFAVSFVAVEFWLEREQLRRHSAR
jgi:uncharacterized membrane protein